MKTLHTIYTNFAKRLAMSLMVLMTVGVGGVFAAQETLSGSFTSSNTTSGGFTASGGAAGSYYKLQKGYIISDASYSVDATKSISVSMKVGTYGSYSVNKQSVDFYAVDKNGNIISNTVTASFSKANSSGATFSGTITLNSGNSGNDVRFKFASNSNATSSVCARFYNFTITYESAPSTFTVTYDDNGATSGTVPTDGNEYDSGTAVTVLGNTGDLVKTGYRFDGWQIDKAGTVYNAGGTFNISENTTLYAKWTEKKLTNYRTSCTTETLDCSLLTFVTNIADNHSATFAKNATADALTVSAQYNGNSTDVTYQWYSNNTNSNTVGTLIKDATNASYTPSTSIAGTTYYYCEATYDKCSITSNVATIVVNPTYTVTFDSDGGSEVTPQTIEKGKTATKPTDPTKTGYTFESWFYEGSEFDFNTPITENITLTAQWIINRYTVTLNPNYPNGKTGTFTYDAGELVDGNLVLTYDYNTASMTIEDLYTSLTLDGYEFGGWYNAKGVNPGEVSGSKCTTTGTITDNKTYFAKWTKLYSITLSENGTTTTPTTQTSTSYTLPTELSVGTCENDEKELVGWSTVAIPTPGDKPTSNFYELGETVTLTADQTTFYAVFATGTTTDEIITTEETATLSFENVAQRTSFSTTQQVWEQNGIVFTNNKAESSNDIADYINPVRCYKNSEIIIDCNALGNITKVLFRCSSSDFAGDLEISIGQEATSDGTWVTLIPKLKSKIYEITLTEGQTRISTLTVTYEKISDNASSVSYSDYTTICEAIPDPVWGGAVINRNSIQVDCGSMTKLNAADPNGPATISFPAATNHTLTYDITVTASEGFLVSTNKTDAAKYGASVTVSPNKTGDNAGKITQNVYVVAVAPAMSDEDFTGTITLSGKQLAEPQVIDVTANVTCTQYTLTLVDRGVSTEQPTKYYAGETIDEAPADPEGVCTDPIHYVFDGWAEAEVTDGSTSYTKVNFPYSMPAANTTLYAVYRYAAGETTPTDDFVSCDINSDGIKSGGEFIITANKDNSYDEYAFNSTINSDGKGSTTHLELTPIDENGDEEDDYYQITTSDNNIIWILEGDIENGYTVKNKQTGTYWNVSGSKLQMGNTSTEKFKFYHPESSNWPIYIYNATSSNYVAAYGTSPVQYNLYNSNTHDIYLYSRKLITSYLYTTSPDCGGIAITYDFAGGDGGHCTDTRVEGGSDYTICEDVPTKTGYTFLHWSDGVNTYNPSDVIVNVTADITLTAIWQINTYTVTWSNNGVTTPVTYEHGDDLTLPSAPASCDGVKEFVGWTEQSGYYHATTAPTDLFKTTTATVTANKTYYAVFATKGEGSANFVLGESGTFKIYANVNGTNYYAQGGVSSSKITSTTEAANASDYTLTYADGVYTIKQGKNAIGHSSKTDLSTTASSWTISAGANGSWRITSNKDDSRALSYSAEANAFKAYATSNLTAGNETYFDIEFGGTSSGYSDYTTTCQQIESIEVQNPKTEFYLTDDFTIGSGKVIATLSGGGTTDVTALATFSGYNMNVVGTYTVTVTYMGATATYDINVNPLDNAWVLTWNVSGKTNTGLGPRTVNKGSAIGTLPVPEVPAACEGKTFMGWTESNTVPSDGIGIVYITPETVPTDNTTYYAVFATVNNFSVQKPIEDITSGSKVVVVAVASLTADGGSGKAISSRATDDTYNLQGDSVAIYDETINTPHSTCIWTITKKDGKYVLTQDGKYLNGVLDGKYSNLKYLNTEDSWTLHPAKSGMTMTYNMESANASGEYIEWFRGKFAIHNEVNDNGDFDMQFYVTANADGKADITDYTTGCEEYTITYYGFRGGYSTSSSSDGIIVLPVNSLHTVPDCGDVVKDHTDLGREFLNLWMTEPHGGHTFKPGDTFILTQDTTLYAQWELNTTTDVTLPTGVEDLAGTDVYVYGGNTLTMVPDIVTINSLTLKGGLQPDGSYQMPNVWIPDGATLVRNTNKIYLDLAINAKNWYPFAVPFATKNDQYLDYLDPVLRGASTYGKHFAIKTYDGARRAEVGEDKANNWKQLLRHTGGTTSYLEPGVGYIISAMTKSDKDTATIRIPMTVPNTWFENGEQTVVGSTSRNTIAVIAHTGAAATEHRRHAGWNFIASPYLSEFAGNKVDNDGTYINGWINIANQYNYEDTEIPYVTIPVYNFAYYEQKKVSEATLSPEWSFFVQIAVDGTIDFVEEGRQTVPAGIAARTQEERSVKMDIDINLTDGRNTDQMGIIVCEKYSDAYEIGRDLEKMFGSAYNLVVYSLMSDNTPLAYQAVPLLNETHAIPIGYRAPEQGEYTFSLKQNTSSIDLLNEQYEQLVLVDYEKGALTNLLNSDYTFSSERTQSNSRFALYAVPRQDSSTELPNISDEEDAIRKIFYNGHLFIIRNGNVYNGNGQIVK